MKRKATSSIIRWCVLLLSCVTLGSGVAMAQSGLMFSKDANFSTEDREFDESDTIFMRIEATDVDFSSVRYSKFRLIPQSESAEYEGEFTNNFDGTYTAEYPISDLDLTDHLWQWEALIEDDAGNAFETRVLLRIGDPNQFSGFEVRAVVQSVNTDFFVLKGYEFLVDDQTEYVFPPYYIDPSSLDPTGFIPGPGNGPQPATFEDVQEGFMVRVRVDVSESGDFAARRVEIHGPPFVPGEVNMSGLVESIDQQARSIVVRGRRVFVSEFTQVGNSGETVGDEEIPEWIQGRQITIFGEFQDDDSILAHYVHVAEGVREELEVRGVVEEVSETGVVVQGFRFEVSDATVIEKEFPEDGKVDGEDGPDGDPNEEGEGGVGKASMDEIDPGLVIRVFGVVDADGVQFAERIRLESGVDNGIRISGAVESASELGFSIRGWQVNVAEHTQLFNENFEPVPFTELFDGQLVLVFGEILDDGTVRAHHVEYRRQERDEFNLFGPISEIGVDYVKVWDVQFSVGDHSVFETDTGEQLTLADLSVGQLVEAIGLPDETGALSIERVFIPQSFGDFVRLNGRMANMGMESFEVLGKTVFLSEETQFRDRNYEPISIEAFADGAAIQVFGNFNPDGSVRAHEVMLTGADREEIELWGVIEAIEGDVVQVGGVGFFVGENTKVFVESETGGEEGTPADLIAGQVVSIIGVVDEAGAVVSDWVYVPRQENEQVRISGTVSGATVTGMVLWGQEVMFTEFTEYYTEDYQPAGPEALVDGLNVDVYGSYDEFGVIQADVVEIRGGSKEELSVTGRIEIYDGQIVVIGGTSFLITAGTQVFDNTDDGIDIGSADGGGKYSGVKLSGVSAGKFAGKRAGLENLEAGLDVEVFGTLNANGEYEATVIHIHDEGDQVHISGSLEAIDMGSLLVLGRVVVVGPETFVQNENFEAVAIESLVEGQHVEVYGEILDDGTVMAYNVEVRPGDGEFLDFWGEIESIQGDLVFVHGTPFTANEFTFINNDKGEALAVGDLAPGVEVNIRGQRDESGVILATDIFVPGYRVWAWMNGELLAVDGESLQVQQFTIATSPETAIFDDTYNPITLSDLEAGATVFVSGEIGEDGVLMAFTVEVRGVEFNELQVFGTLAAVEGDLIEINGRSYIYTANTRITGSDGLELSFEELKAGQFLSLIVVPDGQGGTQIAKIFVETQQNDQNLRMRGAIQELAADGLVLQGRFVLIGEETMLMGPNFEPITLDFLQVDQVVTVFGGFDEEGNVLAYRVETQQGQLAEIEFRGAISEVNGDLFIIRNTEFVLGPNSIIEDDKGFPIDLESLTPGTIANVVGVPTDAGFFEIKWMHVGAGDGDRHINISGTVAEIDRANRTLNVQGLFVKVEEYVEVVGPNFAFIPFAELEDGMSLRVFGQYENGGTVRAHRIEVRSGQGEEIEFRGRLEIVDDATIMVRGLPFTITPNTWIGDDQGQVAFEDLKQGQIVSVVGTPGPEGSHMAVNIFATTGNEDRSIRVSGRLVEVDGDTRVLVVRNHVIDINPGAEIVGDTYERISFDALTQGRQVSIWGWLHEDGKIEGHRVELRRVNKQDFHVVGVLSSVEGRIVSVNGLEVAVPAEAFIGSPDIGRLPFENLFAGLVVSVEGGTGPEGGLIAAKVQVFGLDESETAEFIGTISNLADGQFEIGTIGMSLGAQTFLLNGNDQPIAPALLQDGFNVEAVTFGAGSDLNVRFLRVFDIIQDERSVLGRVENITAVGFSIREHTFLVTEETVFLDPLGDPMEFADLVDRMRVDVKALADGTGNLIAREVQAKPRDRKLTGTVAEIQGDYLVVAGLQISIDPTTRFLNDEDVEIDQTGIVPGQTVNLTFTLGPGGQPLASEVKLLPRIEDEVVLNGTVEAVVEDLIVVLGRRFQVIPNTSMVDENGNTVDLQSYAVGDVVRIRALLLAGDNLVALRISRLDAESADIRVEGPIVSVSASTVEVMGIFFFINETTEFYDINRELVTVDAFAEGQTVFVVGEGQANGTVIANRVQVQNVSLTAGESSGISEEGEFSMFGNDYRVDDNTMVLGENNVQLDLEDVEAGQYLEVRGVAESEGGVAGKSGSSILVSKIKIIDAEGSGEYELEVDPEDVGGTATEDEALPESYALFQNYPNPFNPITTIRFSLPTNTPVTLKVYDVTGREVQTLLSGMMVGGTHEVQWNGRSNAGTPVASGVYLYRMVAGQQIITRRMVLLK